MEKKQQFLNTYCYLKKHLKKLGKKSKREQFMKDIYKLYTVDGVSITRLGNCYHVSQTWLKKEFRKIRNK